MIDELERIRRRRMLELSRKALQKKELSEEKKSNDSESLDDLFEKYFYGKAWEVYRAAHAQFPLAMKKVDSALLTSIKKGTIRERIDGASLFNFLKQIGIHVKLRTTIRFKEHGELKTIGQKIREKKT